MLGVADMSKTHFLSLASTERRSGVVRTWGPALSFRAQSPIRATSPSIGVGLHRCGALPTSWDVRLGWLSDLQIREVSLRLLAAVPVGCHSLSAWGPSRSADGMCSSCPLHLVELLGPWTLTVSSLASPSADWVLAMVPPEIR